MRERNCVDLSGLGGGEELEGVGGGETVIKIYCKKKRSSYSIFKKML